MEEHCSYEDYLPCSDFELQGECYSAQYFYNEPDGISASFSKCDEFPTTSSHIRANGTPMDSKYLYDIAHLNEAQHLVTKTEDQCRMKFQSHQEKTRGSLTYERTQKLITRRKRRTIFNTEQILTLEKIFKKKPYVSREERQVLMQMLNVSDRVIKVWFQNRRRLSGKKDMEPLVNYNSDSSIEENELKISLDYVESKIKEVDEFGYVTLDDRALRELFTVIDSLLTGVDLNELDVELKAETFNNTTYYEPISPVSIQDASEEITNIPHWEPYEPEDALRHLFDVQALITM